jgi:hypothetical protein
VRCGPATLLSWGQWVSGLLHSAILQPGVTSLESETLPSWRSPELLVARFSLASPVWDLPPHPAQKNKPLLRPVEMLLLKGEGGRNSLRC